MTVARDGRAHGKMRQAFIDFTSRGTIIGPWCGVARRSWDRLVDPLPAA